MLDLNELPTETPAQCCYSLEPRAFPWIGIWNTPIF